MSTKPKIPDSVAKYMGQKSKAERLQQGRLHAFRRAQLEAEAGFYKDSDAELDLSALKDPKMQAAYAKTIADSMEKAAKKYLGIGAEKAPEWDIFRQTTLLKGGFAGFDYLDVKSAVEQLKDKTTYDSLFEAFKKPLGATLQGIGAVPYTALSVADAPEIAKWTGLEKRVKPDRLGISDLAEILETYDQFGTIPPKFLDSKPYKI